MSEQLTLEQGLGNGTGIYADHRFQSPVGQAVNLGSQHVFPRSVLAGNQNTRVGRSDLLDRATDSRHGRSRSPQHRRSGFSDFLQPFSADFSTFSVIGFRLVNGSLQGSDEFLVLPRLHNEVECPTFHAFHRQSNVGIRRKKHHFRLRTALFDFGEPEQTLISRIGIRLEIHIQQDDIRRKLPQRRMDFLRRSQQLHRREILGQ